MPARRPTLIVPGSPPVFPPASTADEDGLVAVGGDLEAARLLAAYDGGIFPWYDQKLPPLWWSPDPRAVIEAKDLHISRSMRRELRHTELSLSFNRAFRDVMLACGQGRSSGTWIIPEMVDAYTRLHQLGHAHSFEAFRGERLVAGLYGVQRGGLFAAESMFHLETNASKIVLIAAVLITAQFGISLFDVQFLTPHLSSLGARSLPRAEYLERLRSLTSKTVDLGALAGEANLLERLRSLTQNQQSEGRPLQN